MKKKIFLVFVMSVLSWNVISQDQNASVEQSTFGVQTGILGLWVHNEARLVDQIALRSEIGLEAGGGEDVTGEDFIFFAPVITLEPRWYYNLNKRKDQSRPIDGNSGNFVSLKISYHPDLFTINLPNNIIFLSDISVVPTWGIRRNFDEHFNYEAAIGVGYSYYSEEENVRIINDTNVAVNLHVRIGYRF